VFEGLTHVQSLARAWYTDNLRTENEGQKAREAEKKRTVPDHLDFDPESLASLSLRPSPSRATFSYSNTPEDGDVPESVSNTAKGEPSGLKIISAEPIVERRSTFVGHAVRVTDEREVPLVIHELLSDRKIAKAAHPAIFAYRIAKNVGGAAGRVYNTGQSMSASRRWCVGGMWADRQITMMMARRKPGRG
jgi:hypothetical protein